MSGLALSPALWRAKFCSDPVRDHLDTGRIESQGRYPDVRAVARHGDDRGGASVPSRLAAPAPPLRSQPGVVIDQGYDVVKRLHPRTGRSPRGIERRAVEHIGLDAQQVKGQEQLVFDPPPTHRCQTVHPNGLDPRGQRGAAPAQGPRSHIVTATKSAQEMAKVRTNPAVGRIVPEGDGIDEDL